MVSKVAVKRPVTTIMALMMIVVLGIASLINIPQALMPDVELPVALAMVTYPGAGPEEIETLVTEPMEKQMASLEGLDNLMSMTMENISIVVAQFDMGTDMNFATLDMREKISLAQMYFPDDVGNPTIMKMSMDAAPVMQIYASGDMDLADLNDLVEENLKPQFERVSGVASVDVYGGSDDEISVQFDQEKLAGYGLTLDTIASILAAENISLPSGDVTKGNAEIIVRTIGEFKNIDEIRDLPLTVADRSIIHLGDVAEIVQQKQEQESISRIDGKQSVGIMITKSTDGNIVEVSDDTQKVIEEIEENFPQIDLVVGFDQADYIRLSLDSVIDAAIMGAILAVIVIFLFLRNIRSTLVIAISIPSSVLFTFALMNAMGLTLNLFTLCSLTLAVGMLVDNSVVVLENIFRTGKLGMNPYNAAIEGSKEVFLAVAASTLTSIVVYLPIALSGGMAGMMFREFSLTIVAALVASLIVAMTAVPMLCSKLLDGSVSEDYVHLGGNVFYKYKLVPLFTKFVEYITRSYESFITYALERRKRIVAGCVGLFILSVTLVGIVGMELLPATDEGTFSVSVEMPYGTPVDERNALMLEIEEYVLQIPEVEHATLSIGQTSAFSSGDVSSMSVVLMGKSERERSTAEIVREVRKEFSDIVGADLSVEESSMTSMALGGTDIQLDIMGNDLESVEKAANDLAVQAKGVAGVVLAESGAEEGNPELVVSLDRSVAAHYGVTAYQLSSALSQALGGTTATELKVDGDEIEINLSLSDEYGASVENMKQITIATATGARVPVGQIAEFEFGNAPTVIMRQNQQNVVSVTIDIDESRDLASVSEDINQIVDRYDFPDGVYVETGGMEEQMEETFGDLLLALVVSILLVYLILAAQFESIVLPIMIMVSIPFAMSGAFFALFLTGTRLSVTAFVGLIMLVGIVVNNSILLVEFIKQNKESMSRNVAIVQAGVLRLRPILMTSLTTCIGMIPLAIGSGEGMEMLAPMGISIIGGMIASTLVTLIIIPVLYAYVDDKEQKNKEKRNRRKQKNLRLEAAWLEKEAKKSGSSSVL